MKIKFEILGPPRPKGRPKFFRKGNFVGTYTPKTTREAEQNVLIQALPHRPPKPLDEALRLTAIFHMPIPTSMSKKKRNLAINKFLRPTKRPDLDNLTKIKDALNKVFWTDDAVIVEEFLYKVYSETPKTEITIETIFAKQGVFEYDG